MLWGAEQKIELLWFCSDALRRQHPPGNWGISRYLAKAAQTPGQSSLLIPTAWCYLLYLCSVQLFSISRRNEVDILSNSLVLICWSRLLPESKNVFPEYCKVIIPVLLKKKKKKRHKEVYQDTSHPTTSNVIAIFLNVDSKRHLVF